MLKNIVQKIGGDPNKKAIEVHSDTVERINGLEPVLETLTDKQLGAKTEDFKGVEKWLLPLQIR